MSGQRIRIAEVELGDIPQRVATLDCVGRGRGPGLLLCEQRLRTSRAERECGKSGADHRTALPAADIPHEHSVNSRRVSKVQMAADSAGLKRWTIGSTTLETLVKTSERYSVRCVTISC